MYSIKKSNLFLKAPPNLYYEGVVVTKPLYGSFLYALVGKPGSGKSYLIYYLILDCYFYRKKFDMVIFVTPSSMPKLNFSSENWSQTFDIDWLYTKIKELNDRNLYQATLLIVIDDYIDYLYYNRMNPKLLNLVFNRRHLLYRNGVINFIITSQKYKLLPTFMRTCYTGLFIFKLNQEDWKAIREDNFQLNAKLWENILPELFQETNQIRPFLYINKVTDEYFRNFDKIELNYKSKDYTGTRGLLNSKENEEEYLIKKIKTN